MTSEPAKLIPPVTGLDPAIVTEAIEAADRANPFPKREFDRLEARRYILNGLPKGGVGAEIGVFRGHFSDLICSALTPRKIYAIDPWTRLGEHFGWGTGEYVNRGRLTTLAARDEATMRLARHPETEVRMIEGFYPEAGTLVEEPLDWAYLDASHDFQPTFRELKALGRAVKKDGYILGDDWEPDPNHHQHGVYRAVQKFVAESNWEIISCGPARQWKLRRKAPRHPV